MWRSGPFCSRMSTRNAKTQDRYAGKIQHTYTGTTPVTEKMWQDLMKKAISATASSTVLANKYKQMKNKMQQTQVATTTTTSPAKTTQKQYSFNPKTSTVSNTQTSVMKTVGRNITQNQSKNQNWKGKGNKINVTNTTSNGASVPTTSKNDKLTSPITRSKAKML